MKNGWELTEISQTLIQYLNHNLDDVLWIVLMVNFSLMYLQTKYNMFCLLLKIPVERNNIMTKYSVKKSGF